MNDNAYPLPRERGGSIEKLSEGGNLTEHSSEADLWPHLRFKTTHEYAPSSPNARVSAKDERGGVLARRQTPSGDGHGAW